MESNTPPTEIEILKKSHWGIDAEIRNHGYWQDIVNYLESDKGRISCKKNKLIVTFPNAEHQCTQLNVEKILSFDTDDKIHEQIGWHVAAIQELLEVIAHSQLEKSTEYLNNCKIELPKS